MSERGPQGGPSDEREVFERLVEETPDAALLLEAGTRRILACNRAAERFFGCEAGELRGETTERLHVDREQAERFHREGEAQLRAEGVFVTPWSMRRGDGSVVSTVHREVLLRRDGEAGLVFSTLRAATEAPPARGPARVAEELRGELARAGDAREGLDALLEALRREYGWDYAEAWTSGWWDDLELFAAAFEPDPDLERFRELSRAITLRAGEDAPGRAWVSGEPEWIPDVQEMPRSLFRRRFAARACGLRSAFVLAVPNEVPRVAVLLFASARAREREPATEKAVAEVLRALAPALAEVLESGPAALASARASRLDPVLARFPVPLWVCEPEGFRILDRNEAASVGGGQLEQRNVPDTRLTDGLLFDEKHLRDFEPAASGGRQAETRLAEYRFHGDAPEVVRGTLLVFAVPWESGGALTVIALDGITLSTAAIRRALRLPERAERLEQLTARELQIVEHLVQGRSSKEIAEVLSISPRTVDTHRSAILRKMGVDSLGKLIAALTRLGG